jgi:hypothetical protein
MSSYKITIATKLYHPSLCYLCAKALKPTSEEFAKEGLVGCRAHLERMKYPDPDKPQEREMSPHEIAENMVGEGIACEKAVTGWSTTVPIDSDSEVRSSFNSILLVKGCSYCCFRELKEKSK